MRKIISLIVLASTSVFSFAQITFDYTPPANGPFAKFSTTDLGELYLRNDYNNDTLFLYNSDWSLYRAITLPSGHTYINMKVKTSLGGSYSYGDQPILSFSDKLFDNDAQIEFLTTTNSSSPDTCYLHVVNELGQVEFTFPLPMNLDLLGGIGIEGLPTIYKIGNVFKLWYREPWDANMFARPKIFNLPGTLPCDPCGMINGMTTPGIGGELSGMKAYPNPFNQTLSIEYNFSRPQDGKIVLLGIDGKELKSINLNNQSDKLTLSTSDLPNGVIIVNLYGKNGNLISKKLVKIE